VSALAWPRALFEVITHEWVGVVLQPHALIGARATNQQSNLRMVALL